ncbi:hypothetical protein LPJ61_002997 [Coemansia biformis]|uniref:Nudix hydrolase domain-containing protein n=1 Tax=Coemansia biformis TaxID=1286918 RepID=A0A9W7Y7B3_9FUNG|nr:hypothetical protein LPJ61_002997 [Coemansia biformis]
MTLLPSASLVVTAPLEALAVRAASACNYAVLMVRRVGGGSFASGYVFPGGVEEPGDRRAASAAGVHAHCAVRETFEETGLLLTTAPAGGAVPRGGPFDELCARHAIAPLRPLPLARWVTPRAQKKRFDTRFLMLNIGDRDRFLLRQLGSERVQPAELVRLDWVPPDVALSANARGEMPLFPPQAYILHALSRCRRWQDLPAAVPSAAQADQPVEPLLCRRSDGLAVALLPGDRAHGTCVPDDASLFCSDRSAPGLHRLELVPADAGGFHAATLLATPASAVLPDPQ